MDEAFIGGGWVASSVAYCPGDAGLAAAGEAVVIPNLRAEAIKRLPKPSIASAPPPAPRGLPLVNVDIIFWLGTAAGQQGLGSAVLLGHAVDFRARVDSVAWTFGDSSAATSAGPGRAYDFAVNPCRTPRCPGFFTHVYAKKGPVVVTAAATWFGQYRVDGGVWTDIGAVTSATATLALTIREARVVLVDTGR